tara:strand:+ start:1303 stop:2373 length:1071 start_codon:yes stop_codon:yes gene_type:complete
LSKNFLKNLIRIIKVKLFFNIYPKVRLAKKKLVDIHEIKNKKFGNKKYQIFEVNNARIFTNCVENLSIIKNDQLIPQGSFQQINSRLVKPSLNETLRSGTPKILKKINGTVLVLEQGASGFNNYSHWFMDILPKIELASSIMNLKKFNYFYFSKLNNFQKDTLKLLKINNKIIDSGKYRHIKANKVIFLTHPYYTKGTFPSAQNNLPKWIIHNARNKFLKFKINKNKKYKKIFIDRSDSTKKHCKLINNGQVKNYLSKKGFKILRMSDFSFREQITFFYNAKIIVAPHGAGLTNLIFGKKNSKVIEIKPNGVKNTVLERISSINNINHKVIKLKNVKNNINGDMFLKIEKLKKILF